MYCRYCGKDIADNDNFCIACGKPTGIGNTASSAGAHTAEGNVPDSTAVELIGKNTDYYVSCFQKLKWSGKRTSWNWPAFFAGPWWMVYRKLYGWAAGYVLLNLLLAPEGVGIITWVISGLFANYIYMQHIENLTAEAKRLYGEQRTQFIRKKGGVNVAAVIALFVLFAVFIVLIISLIFAFMNTTMYDPYGYYWWN